MLENVCLYVSVNSIFLLILLKTFVNFVSEPHKLVQPARVGCMHVLRHELHFKPNIETFKLKLDEQEDSCYGKMLYKCLSVSF